MLSLGLFVASATHVQSLGTAPITRQPVGMCKPWKKGWMDKKDHHGQIEAVRADQQLREL
jgi:hypothetical protein